MITAFKKLIPIAAKQKLHYFFKQIKYAISGYCFKIATETKAMQYPLLVKKIIQPLHQNHNKKGNIFLALMRINGIILKPGAIFSFWDLVGYPSQKKGYTKSRAISKKTISQEVGGGLCQLSGLIYYLALHANLQIIERYNHSIDIYKDDERFTPLGSDATVFYGYKNLLFKNTTSVALQFIFTIEEDTLTGNLLSEKSIELSKITFSEKLNNNIKEVKTTVINKLEIKTYSSTYKIH